eukprot:scaffold6570_cov51-Attheya_sp.AAC.2
MLNFAEQTGSGAVIFVWSFLNKGELSKYIAYYYCGSGVAQASKAIEARCKSERRSEEKHDRQISISHNRSPIPE